MKWYNLQRKNGDFRNFRFTYGLIMGSLLHIVAHCAFGE